MFDGGVHTHYVATALCARLLRAARGGLVVTISAHVVPEARAGYGAACNVAKPADDSLALATSTALAADGWHQSPCTPGWSAPRA